MNNDLCFPAPKPHQVYSGAKQQRSDTDEIGPCKRQKSLHCTQFWRDERRLSSSPQDSQCSSQTINERFEESPQSNMRRLGPPGKARGISMTGALTAGIPDVPRSCRFNFKYYTPPAHIRQEPRPPPAPKAERHSPQSYFDHACALISFVIAQAHKQACMSGFELQLDSFTVAMQIAYAEAFLATHGPVNSIVDKVSTAIQRCQQSMAPVVQPAFVPSYPPSWATRKLHVAPTEGLCQWTPAATRRLTFRASEAVQRTRTNAFAAPPLSRVIANPAQILGQWAGVLRLHDDTVHLAHHIYRRLDGKFQAQDGEDSAVRKTLYLAGSLWIAAKQEEGRVGLPSASKLSALLADVGQQQFLIRSSTINQAELLVLNLVDWQPLKGWHDLHHVKGRPREQSEILWLNRRHNPRFV